MKKIKGDVMEKRKVVQEELKNEFGELEGIFIPNYRKKEHFLTNPEYKLFRTLKEIYKDDNNIEIFVQVALNQILEFNNERAKQYFSYFKLEDRSIDFVIYNTNKKNIGILYCIELNDKSHESDDRRERDKILSKMFETAKIELKFIKLEDIEKDIVNNKEYFNIDSVKKHLGI